MQAEAGASLISSAPKRSSSPSGARATTGPSVPLVATVALIAGVAIALDRLTKAWALDNLVPGVPQPFLGSVLQLTLLFNPGAAFSLGTGVTPLFTVIQAAVAVAVLVMMFRVRSGWWATGMGFLLGGATGNLIDRLTRPPGFARGHVVDFLQLPHWPVFNIADSCVVTAACVIAVAAFRGIPFRPDAADADADDRAAGAGPDTSHASNPETPHV